MLMYRNYINNNLLFILYQIIITYLYIYLKEKNCIIYLHVLNFSASLYINVLFGFTILH